MQSSFVLGALVVLAAVAAAVSAQACPATATGCATLNELFFVELATSRQCNTGTVSSACSVGAVGISECTGPCSVQCNDPSSCYAATLYYGPNAPAELVCTQGAEGVNCGYIWAYFDAGTEAVVRCGDVDDQYSPDICGNDALFDASAGLSLVASFSGVQSAQLEPPLPSQPPIVSCPTSGAFCSILCYYQGCGNLVGGVLLTLNSGPLHYDYQSATSPALQTSPPTITPFQFYWDGQGGVDPTPAFFTNAGCANGQWYCPNLDACVNPRHPGVFGVYSGECDVATTVLAFTQPIAAAAAGARTIDSDVSDTVDCLIMPENGNPVSTGYTISNNGVSFCCAHRGVFFSADQACARPVCNAEAVKTSSYSPISLANQAQDGGLADGDRCVQIDNTCYETPVPVAADVYFGSAYSGQDLIASNSINKRASGSSSVKRDSFVSTSAGYRPAFVVTTSSDLVLACAVKGEYTASQCLIKSGCNLVPVESYILDEGAATCYAQCYSA